MRFAHALRYENEIIVPDSCVLNVERAQHDDTIISIQLFQQIRTKGATVYCQGKTFKPVTADSSEVFLQLQILRLMLFWFEPQVRRDL